MDERLEKALEFSNYMVTLNNQKRLLKEKYFEDLLYFENGCQFSVSKELINFVSMLLDKGMEDAVLTDDNDIPTTILDLQKFYDNILNVYFSASNEYFTQYEKIKAKRTVENLVE